MMELTQSLVLAILSLVISSSVEQLTLTSHMDGRKGTLHSLKQDHPFHLLHLDCPMLEHTCVRSQPLCNITLFQEVTYTL